MAGITYIRAVVDFGKPIMIRFGSTKDFLETDVMTKLEHSYRTEAFSLTTVT